MRRSAYTVKPSLSQKCSAVAFVTRLPVHECASSCATTLTSERSPASSVGVRNVSRGFSMPPYGNDGGIVRMSKRSQSYGAEQRLGRRQHVVDVGELPRRRLDHRRLGPHARARPQVARREVADREREQVRRNRLRHLQRLLAAAAPPIGRRHQRAQRAPAPSARVVGDAHARRVLQRHQRARVDRLALREQERLHAARRLRRRQPLQRRRRPATCGSECAPPRARRAATRSRAPRIGSAAASSQRSGAAPSSTASIVRSRVSRSMTLAVAAQPPARPRTPSVRVAKSTSTCHVRCSTVGCASSAYECGSRPHRRTTNILITRASTNSLPLKIGRPPYAFKNVSVMKFSVPDAPTEKSTGPSADHLARVARRQRAHPIGRVRIGRQRRHAQLGRRALQDLEPPPQRVVPVGEQHLARDRVEPRRVVVVADAAPDERRVRAPVERQVQRAYADTDARTTGSVWPVPSGSCTYASDVASV